jgi:hypothetical protein
MARQAHYGHKNTHTFFLSRKEGGKHEYEVAFAIKKEERNKVLDFKAINERICLLRIKTKFGNLTTMIVYA